MQTPLTQILMFLANYNAIKIFIAYQTEFIYEQANYKFRMKNTN